MIPLDDTGHTYKAQNFENKNEFQVIQFIHKEPAGGQTPEGTLKTVQDGTTNEELLEILLHRLDLMNKKFPDRRNAIAITHIEIALLFLFERTRQRKLRGVEGMAKA